MVIKVKRIIQLNAIYDTDNIQTVISKLRNLPLMLHEDQKYYIKQENKEIHIYGTNKEIDQYVLNDLGQNSNLSDIKSNNEQIQLTLKNHNRTDINKIIIHSKQTFNLEQLVGRNMKAKERIDPYFNNI